MVDPVITPIVVRTIFGAAVDRLLGDRVGLPWDKNPLFGGVVRALGERGTLNVPGIKAVAPTAPTQNLPATVPQRPPPFNPPSTVVYYPPPPPPKSPPPPKPPKSPPPPAGSTPPINPNAPPPSQTVITGAWPYVIGSVILPDVWRWTKEGAGRAFDWYVAGKGPTSRPAGPIRRGRKRGRIRTPAQPGRGDPFPPQGAPPQRAERIPRGERVQARLDTLGGDIYVNPKRLPMPAAVPPRVPPKPLWQTLLPLVPGLLGFLQPGQGNKNVLRLTDPLTRPATDSGNPFPLTGTQTSVQSFGAFGGGAGTVGTNTCECKAPRKKGRKKKRTVCYSGTFIERADGTRKTKKRKVQC